MLERKSMSVIELVCKIPCYVRMLFYTNNSNDCVCYLHTLLDIVKLMTKFRFFNYNN